MLEPAISIGADTEALFRPAVEKYADILLQRFLPIFEDVDGEQQRAAQEMLDAQGWTGDCEAAAQAAYDYITEQVLIFLEMRSVFLATGVAGMFHLFEKQIIRHIGKELHYFELLNEKGSLVEIDRWSRADELIRQLHYRASGDGPSLLDVWKSLDLKELREVANAVKHGAGRALSVLRSMGAPVVEPSRLSNDWTVGPFSILSVPISITAEDVIRYRDAILAVWRVRGTFSLPPESYHNR